MNKFQKPIVFFCPMPDELTGGMKYSSFVIKKLRQIVRIRVVDVRPQVNFVATRLAPLLRRYAFKSWLLESVMAFKLALQYTAYSGIILIDYEYCRYTWILCYLSSMLARTTIIFLYHFDDRDTTDLRSQLAIRRRRILHSSHIITISKYSQNEVIKSGYPAEKITVASPGTNQVFASSIYVPSSSEKTRFLLCVANIIPHKGHQFLVSAVQQCNDRDFKLILVGNQEIDPAYARKISQDIVAAGLDKRVRLTGRIQDDELKYLYSKATGFVFPSLMEGYCMAIAEALTFVGQFVSAEAGDELFYEDDEEEADDTEVRAV